MLANTVVRMPFACRGGRLFPLPMVLITRYSQLAAALKAERLDMLDRTPGEAAPVGRIVMLGDDMLGLCLAEEWYEFFPVDDAVAGRSPTVFRRGALRANSTVATGAMPITTRYPISAS
ncbi:hypothetical protein ACU8LZ_31990 (plasmid) [Rhizobium leguminosarum]|uniref:hypothetical protein n=1 Tax=Rhizobium leguminosarum TaxID=384 RepID=UPI00197F11FA|nr:hypothetical protein [Rhizobium leguminosarum]MDV4161869.1 hypothetical protein [Rhizobium leguminosarum]MDV4172248.1 hypothetical protein [Rhizobium leguminosarum]